MSRILLLTPRVLVRIARLGESLGPMSAAAMAATLAEEGVHLSAETTRRGMRMVGIAPSKVQPKRCKATMDGHRCTQRAGHASPHSAKVVTWSRVSWRDNDRRSHRA